MILLGSPILELIAKVILYAVPISVLVTSARGLQDWWQSVRKWGSHGYRYPWYQFLIDWSLVEWAFFALWFLLSFNHLTFIRLLPVYLSSMALSVAIHSQYSIGWRLARDKRSGSSK